MARSRYDELHDKYYELSSSKAGTRYERLAAVVFKLLDGEGTVIHDLKLVGESEVKHQIDVTVERDGRTKRLLVECKDFDVSGEMVGLEVIRNFWAVVDDTKPDEALVLTCTGFTSGAAKYAKAKKIKLAVVRSFEDADWEGRIREVVVRIKFSFPARPEVSLKLSAAGQAKYLSDVKAAGLNGAGASKGDPVHIVENGTRMLFLEYIEERMNRYHATSAGPVRLDLTQEHLFLEVEDRGRIPIEGLVLAFTVSQHEQVVHSISDRIASLMVQGLGTADMVVFDDDLRRFVIDDATGEVMPSV